MQVKKRDWQESMQTQNILHDDECQYNNFKYICYAKGHFTQEYVNKNEICFVGTKGCSKIKYVSKKKLQSNKCSNL